MTIKKWFTVIVVSAGTSVGSLYGFSKWQQQNETFSSPFTSSLFKNAAYVETASEPMVDFEKAASKAAPAVVHIKTLTKARQVSDGENSNNPFKDFFGDDFGDMFKQRGGSPEQRASGSGVLITADGYIVTNNHVVDGADELLVTLNNKKDYKAKLVGKDPGSDLAVLKIDAAGLPFLGFANSDNVHLGQWVLAIGYPLKP